ESDTLKIKVGNGSSAWGSLAYATITPAELENGISSLKVTGTMTATSWASKVSSVKRYVSTQTQVERTVITLLTLPTSGKKGCPAYIRVRVLFSNYANLAYIQRYAEKSFLYKGQTSSYSLEELTDMPVVTGAGGAVSAANNTITITMPNNGTNVSIGIYAEVETLSPDGVFYTLNTDAFKDY
ncbi:MAG: hypothetical protein IJG36_02890, partial [Synergistaceae bacterium]|nr:hypothetical protein [Synergistaceae bacterium]